MHTHFVGIDVQTARPCACAVLRLDGASVGTTWHAQVPELVAAIQEILASDAASLATCAIGIDSPRFPMNGAREHYWDGARQRWRSRSSTDTGHGRHCEVVVKSLGLANPQWTPPGDAPDWMKLGFDLYKAFAESGAIVYEVFPSASYSQFQKVPLTIQIDLSNFAIGPKDMLDAYVCAATIREYELGNGSAVGDGDRLGSIILPRRTAESNAGVLTWPVVDGFA